MSMSKCVECGKQVSTTAEACPSCGNPEPTVTGKQKQDNKESYIGFIILLVFGGALLKACDIV